MSTTRTTEEWETVLRPLHHPNLIARRVLGDLVHYREDGEYRGQDEEQLANAIMAIVHLEIERSRK